MKKLTDIIEGLEILLESDDKEEKGGEVSKNVENWMLLL
jgi:flagellin-specific chaperone FliS